MSKRYALKGVNDDESTCSICGKIELKRVMWLVELDQDGNAWGDAFPVGTSCGSKMLGWTYGKLNTRVKNYENQAISRRYSLRLNKERELGRQEILESLHALDLPFKDRRVHPLSQKLREIEQEAITWAALQEIVIELV